MNYPSTCADLQKRNIRKTILHAGVGDLPAFVDGGKVTFHYRCALVDEDRTVLDDSRPVNKPMELIFGKQFKLEVWEALLKTMRIKEVAEFLVSDIKDTASYPAVAKSLRDINSGHNHASSHHCCGMMMDGEGTGYSDLNELMKKLKPLYFTFELLKYEAPEDFQKEMWTMTMKEKEGQIPLLREQGKELFKKNRFHEAEEKYSTALGLLEQLALQEKPGDEEWVDVDKKRIPFLLNYSQCRMLAGDYYAVISHTSEVLNKDYASENDRLKALFRRGKAHAAVWNVKEAYTDLQQVARLDPTLTKSVAKELRDLDLLLKEKEDQEKLAFKGMFS